jgi:hypothetical protein
LCGIGKEIIEAVLIVKVGNCDPVKEIVVEE